MHLNEVGPKKPFYNLNKPKTKEEVGKNKRAVGNDTDTFDMEDEENYIPTPAEYEAMKKKKQEEAEKDDKEEKTNNA